MSPTPISTRRKKVLSGNLHVSSTTVAKRREVTGSGLSDAD
ncbi:MULTISPECIES: hypothetical protein [Brucella/Ochrobactrum group]|nr:MULTISPECIES: hypothetical protein [Brucella/Ochrobactrum group]WPM82163.1 hypothetical protein R5W60_20670 [Brucella pseudintermedia]